MDTVDHECYVFLTANAIKEVKGDVSYTLTHPVLGGVQYVCNILEMWKCTLQKSLFRTLCRFFWQKQKKKKKDKFI